MTPEKRRDLFRRVMPVLLVAAAYLSIAYAFDVAVYGFLFVVGFAEVEPLWEIGLDLRQVPWWMGFPFMQPLLLRSMPETINPFSFSPAGLIGYPASALLWSAVLCTIFRSRLRPRLPRA